MAKPSCVLCGKELGLLERRAARIAGTTQVFCPECEQIYLNTPWGEKIRLLDRIAMSPHLAQRQEFMAQLPEYQDELEQLQAGTAVQENGDGMPDCCGGKMVPLGTFQLERVDDGIFRTYEFQRLSLLRCPACGQIKAYDPSFLPNQYVRPQPEEEPQVTCPVCGARHSPKTACTRCTMERAADLAGGRRSYVKKEPKAKEPKMPWEE